MISTISFQASIPSLMLTSKKLDSCLLSKNNKINITTLQMRRLLNFGSRFSPTAILSVNKSRKETNHCLNILSKLKQAKLRIWRNYGLTSTSLKTSGSLMPSCIRSSNLMGKSSRRVQETKSTGRKERTSPLRSSRRRKTKRKEESKKSNRWRKSHSLTSSLMLKSTATNKKNKMNKKITRLNN